MAFLFFNPRMVRDGSAAALAQSIKRMKSSETPTAAVGWRHPHAEAVRKEMLRDDDTVC